MMQHRLIARAVLGIGLLLAGCAREAPQKLTDEQTDELIVSMIEKLEEPDPRGKIVAAMFLSGQGEKAQDAIPKLQELSKDKNPAVRDAAAAALAKLEGSGEN